MRIRKSDQRALLLLFVVLSVAWGAVMLDRWLHAPSSSVTLADVVGADSLAQQADSTSIVLAPGDGRSQENTPYAVPVQPVETFPFDPNTADSTTLLRLGLAPWQVRSIYRYRAKGGRWHRPEDFKHTPGMTPELWQRLGPMVRIGEAFRFYHDTDPAIPPKSELSRPGTKDSAIAGQSSNATFQEKFREMVQLDLNTVDTTTLKMIPGIASVRAARIVRYRDRLGGFASLEQLAEVEDLPEGIEKWFVVQTPPSPPLAVNTSSARELARHPYLSFAQARAIANHVRVHGAIKSLDELGLLPEFTEAELQRLKPYVAF